MKASLKHANISPPSLLRLFPTVELTNQSLDAAFIAERWPTRLSMGPRGYSQLHCRADQPVALCSLVAIIGGYPMMRVSPAWVVTPWSEAGAPFVEDELLGFGMAATAEILSLWPLSGRTACVAPSFHLRTMFCTPYGRKGCPAPSCDKNQPIYWRSSALRRHVGKTTELANLDITYWQRVSRLGYLLVSAKKEE